MPVFVNWKWWSPHALAAAGGPTERGWAHSQALCCNRREKVPLPWEFTLSANKARSGIGIANFIYKGKTKSLIKNLRAASSKTWSCLGPIGSTGFTQMHAFTPLQPQWIHPSWAQLWGPGPSDWGQRVRVTLQCLPPVPLFSGCRTQPLSKTPCWWKHPSFHGKIIKISSS